MRLAGFLPYFLIGLWSANSGSCELPSLPGLMGSDKSGGLESLDSTTAPTPASVLALSIFFFFSFWSHLQLYFIFTETQVYRDRGEKAGANKIGWAKLRRGTRKGDRRSGSERPFSFPRDHLKASYFSLEHWGRGQLVSNGCVGSEYL